VDIEPPLYSTGAAAATPHRAYTPAARA